jgi:hypothetical protein
MYDSDHEAAVQDRYHYVKLLVEQVFRVYKKFHSMDLQLHRAGLLGRHLASEIAALDEENLILFCARVLL